MSDDEDEEDEEAMGRRKGKNLAYDAEQRALLAGLHDRGG